MLQTPARGYSIITTLRKELTGDSTLSVKLLHPAVDRAHQRDALQQLLPPADQLPADEVGDQQTRQQQHDEGEHRAEARQGKAQQRLRAGSGPAAAAGCGPSGSGRS